MPQALVDFALTLAGNKFEELTSLLSSCSEDEENGGAGREVCN